MTAKHTILPVFIPHEGCLHKCVFCDQRRIAGAGGPYDVCPAISESATDRIRALVGAALAKGRRDGDKAIEMAFYGGSFTALPEQRQKELAEAARPLLEQDPRNSIRISTRPDCIDETIVARLKDYGVRTVELGAQSMCDDVLNASSRGHLALDVVKASALLKEKGFSLVLQMMTGLPCDTSVKSIYTANRLISLDPDAVRIYPAVIIKGTKLHEMWINGEYREHTLNEAVTLCSVLFLMFENAGIPVIRLGLNPSDELSGGEAVAGAYHPAFGGLVRSRIYYSEAAALLSGIEPGSDVTIAVAKGCTSMMVGDKRRNIEDLGARFGLRSLKIVETVPAQG